LKGKKKNTALIAPLWTPNFLCQNVPKTKFKANMKTCSYLFIYLFIYLLTFKYYYYYSWTPTFSEEVSRAASKLLDLIYLLTQSAWSLGDELMMPFQHVLLG
jgi:hypothetical protein